MFKFTVVGAVVLVTALAGCSSSSDNQSADAKRNAALAVAQAAKSRAATVTPNPPKADVPDDASSNVVSVAPAKAEITVNDTQTSLTGPVTCFSLSMSDGDELDLWVGDALDINADMASVTLDPETLKVKHIGLFVGDTAVYLSDDKAASQAKATKHGKTYSIKGFDKGFEGKKLTYDIEINCQGAKTSP